MLGHSVVAPCRADRGTILALGERDKDWFMTLAWLPDSALPRKNVVTLNSAAFCLIVEDERTDGTFTRKPTRTATNASTAKMPSIAYVPWTEKMLGQTDDAPPKRQWKAATAGTKIDWNADAWAKF